MADASLSTANAAVEYYVYVYWRSDLSRETPFYVGKGKGRRSHKRDSRNPDFLEIVDSLAAAGTPARVEVSDFMTEREALDLEIELIDFYGRADRTSGPLVNRTAGGDGIKFVSVSPEMRAKASVQLKAVRSRPGFNEKRIARLREAAASEGTKAKHAAAMNKRYESEDARAEQSERMRAVWATGETRAAHASGLSKAWQEHRERVIAGIKKSLVDGGAERRANTMKSKFEGPEGEARRAKIKADSLARWACPAYREKMAASNKAAWESEERRENARRHILEQHKNGIRNKKE